MKPKATKEQTITNRSWSITFGDVYIQYWILGRILQTKKAMTFRRSAPDDDPQPDRLDCNHTKGAKCKFVKRKPRTNDPARAKETRSACGRKAMPKHSDNDHHPSLQQRFANGLPAQRVEKTTPSASPCSQPERTGKATHAAIHPT